MEYPPEFSAQAQAAVESERILADVEFDDARANRLPSYDAGPYLVWLIREYVMRVVAEFAKHACDLGRKGAWTVPEIESQVYEFMVQVSQGASREKSFFANGNRLLVERQLFSMTSAGAMLSSELHFLKSLPQWKEYQRELLAVAARQKDSVSTTTEEDTESGGYKQQNSREATILPILRAKGMTKNKWATRAGVDPAVVYDYLAGRSNPRPDTRQALAEAIEIQEAELPD